MYSVRDYSTLLPLTPEELSRLLSRRRIDENGCWTWAGTRDAEGYGRISLRNRIWIVHRLLYEILVGHVCTDDVLHHLCGNRSCCNPAHLRPISREENSRLAKHYTGIHHHNGSRTHCRRGHLLSGHNLITRRRKDGGTARVCRACLNLSRNNHRRRKRLAGPSWTGDAHLKPLMTFALTTPPSG
jgi:hypothetical protein